VCVHVWQALAPHLEALRTTKAVKPAKKDADAPKGERALVEARLYLTGAVFKMDHHPMEVCQPNSHAEKLRDSVRVQHETPVIPGSWERSVRV
jgi:hypothetical protein